MIKVIQSGPVCEVYQDDRVYGDDYARQKRFGGFRKGLPDEIKKAIIRRARKGVKRLVWANYKKGQTAFLTLTFDVPDAVDYTFARYEYLKFIQRLSYAVSGRKKSTYKYICVPEVQEKSRRYHFHILIFNFPYLEQERIREIWGHNGVHIQRVYNGAEHCANYVCKYFSKSWGADGLRRKKRYSASRNLQRSVVFKGPKGEDYFRNFAFLDYKELYTFVDEKYSFTYSVYYASIPFVQNLQ